MNRVLKVFMTSFLLMALSITSISAAEELNEPSDLTEHIVSEVNTLFGSDLGRDITAKDINWDDAYKIYVGTNVFLLKTNDYKELISELEAGEAIFELPIYVDGSTIIVNIAKGQSLKEDVKFTKEEEKEIVNNVGKWKATAFKFYEDEIVNYIDMYKENSLNRSDDVILVGGLPHFRFAVALIPNELGEVDGLLPLSAVPGIEEINAYRMEKGSNVYDYNEVKDYVNKLPVVDSDVSTGYGFHTTSSNSYYLSIILLGVTILFGIVLYRKRAVSKKL